MSQDIIIDQTIALVGGLIKKPKMTAKLLGKPPFRFLHDIFVAILQETGFPKSLFDDVSLDSSNVQDKDSKIAFLKTWIDCVSAISGVPLAANPTKIVAGMDSENTNIFLQAFAKIAISVRDGQATNDALMAIHQSNQPASQAVRRASNPAIVESKPSPAMIMEKVQNIQSVVEPVPLAIAKTDSPPVLSREIASELLAPELNNPSMNAAQEMTYIERTQAKLGALIVRPTLKPELLMRPPFRFIQDIVKEVQAATNTLGNVFINDELSSKIDGAPAKAAFLQKLLDFTARESGKTANANVKKILAGQDAEKTNEVLQDFADAIVKLQKTKVDVTTGQAQPTIKIANNDPPVRRNEQLVTEQHHATSASTKQSSFANEKAPEKIQSGLELSIAERSTSVQEVPTLARPAPPKVQEAIQFGADADIPEVQRVATGVILEGEATKREHEVVDDDDDDATTSLLRTEADVAPGSYDASGQKHGKLVRDLLKEQEKAVDLVKSQEGANSASDRHVGIKLGRIGARDRRGSYSQQQIEAIRENIQKLCQSVNPLGKCIDFVNEDLDLMRRELERWRLEQGLQRRKLEEEERLTRELLVPLQKQLDKVNGEINDSCAHIRVLRGNILQNDENLKQMLERQAPRRQ